MKVKVKVKVNQKYKPHPLGSFHCNAELRPRGEGRENDCPRRCSPVRYGTSSVLKRSNYSSTRSTAKDIR